ncbi:MAG: M3 family metallopeptidase, partial [bacterium]|nr:M3 family metallopeptidase [bacterium]
MYNLSCVLIAIVAAMTLMSCAGGSVENPLLADWDTPFQAPPFDKIQAQHYMPAFEAAMASHSEEVSTIAASQDSPTFDNTIAALDTSGRLLDRVRLVFVNLNEAHTNDELQGLAKEINPNLARHRDNILLNEALFQRVKTVYDSKQTLDLTTEQERLLDKTYRAFVRGGANLDPASKDRLREINGELSVLSTQFGENLVKEMNAIALLIEDENDLAGLPQSVRDSASALASAHGHENAWAFNLQRTSWTPFLQLSEKRDLREKLYTAYTLLGTDIGEPNNVALASQIAALRVDRAHLLGYNSHAHYMLEENMAENPANVNDLLDKLWTPALARAKVEKAELQSLASSLGDDIDLAMWDWWYYSEKLRAAKYDFDEEAVKPYLQLENVRQAAFDTANKLWGITFEPRTDVAVYHPDVLAFEVKDEDGSHLGLFFVDYFARESKRGGAWMENFRQQWKKDGHDVRPVIVNVCNFSKPSEGQPALIGLDEASTIFHEFGHALHGLLANGNYPGLSGT